MQVQRPGPTDVHVWRAPLKVSGRELSLLASVLSGEEEGEARRFLVEGARIAFTARRGWRRYLLGGYTGLDPQDLVFAKDSLGKPRLDHESASWLRFSCSHSYEIAVFAVASDREVGVDVERLSGDIPMDGITQRFFTESERDAIACASPESRTEAFFDTWTRKEAYLKGLGVGVTGLDSTSKPALVDSSQLGIDDSSREPSNVDRIWSVTRFSAGQGYAAAVAVKGQSMVVPSCAKWMAPAEAQLGPAPLDGS